MRSNLNPNRVRTRIRSGIRYLFPIAMLLFLLGAATTAPSAGQEDAASLHDDYDRLLHRYVKGLYVDYAAWAGDPQDAQALRRYVDSLSTLDPSAWPEDDRLAYWINLYNAVTLRLILDNYPIESIKDLGGFLKRSPWNRELVTVEGRKLTLNAIENEIIRPAFQDPRIHFALNCASIGCPPLKAAAYLPESLSSQLDASCELALNEDRWVRVDGEEVYLSKIFDWYQEDFEVDGGSVLGFINRFRERKLPSETRDYSFPSYDWSLNETP